MGRQQEGRKPPEERRRRLKDSVNNEIKKIIGLKFGVCWILLVQNRDKCWAFVHTAKNIPVPYLLTACGAAGLASNTVLHEV